MVEPRAVLKTKRSAPRLNSAAFAGFDVFEEEPAFDNPLLNLPNFFGTSHRSSLTLEGINAMGLAAINGLDDNINTKQ